MTVQHRSSRYAKHVCPDCDAGLVWTAHPEPAPRPVWTAEQERAAFVAYLRKRVVRSYAQGTIPGTNGCEARTILEAVERGDHLTEKKP
jgi:hypothetical protein